MNRHVFQLISAITLLIAPLNSQAAAVWEVTSEKSTLYIGGTVHMLSEQDYPLPKAYEAAYLASEKLVFETDVNGLNTPDTQQKFQQVVFANDGKTIDQKINQQNLSDLKKYLDSRNIPLANVESFTPSFLATYLSLIELEHLGFTNQGVDEFYAQKANQDSKSIAWLEEIDEQINFLVELEQLDHDFVMKFGLMELNKISELIDSIRTDWRSGDMEALAKMGITELLNDYPSIYRSLLSDRNHNWLPQIENMLTDDTIEFVLVGALHLAGPDSVLTLLENKGYTVSQLNL
ncbi:TraB/GumN family protein [Marinomonas sp. C2222]|uniref:TraB/GumN family protein n=1 Tax=Marinomonas sargassi TaxID=2984494 RepID=A0ABT2YTK2_9GAMM|nr:TraB/GumN family protein [Marinomonas sargassi]MCV2403195.1 TraB/GumN family protein [Marinomonas sargassi]